MGQLLNQLLKVGLENAFVAFALADLVKNLGQAVQAVQCFFVLADPGIPRAVADIQIRAANLGNAGHQHAGTDFRIPFRGVTVRAADV